MGERGWILNYQFSWCLGQPPGNVSGSLSVTSHFQAGLSINSLVTMPDQMRVQVSSAITLKTWPECERESITSNRDLSCREKKNSMSFFSWPWRLGESVGAIMADFPNTPR